MRHRCILVFVCCCALGSSRWATGAPTTAAGSLLAAESEDEPTTRPTAALIVTGGDEQAVYRGWPISIRLQNFNSQDSAPAALSVSGPAKVETVAAPQAPGVWLISAEKSQAITAGAYVFSAGGARAEVAVSDEPATLSPEQQSAKVHCRISYAMASNDLAGAESAAREWVKVEPKNIEALAALGDVLVEAGKQDEAQDAYAEALNHVPPGARSAAAELYRRLGDIRRGLVGQMTTRPAEAPSADEKAYYKIVAEGDAARDAMNDAAALRAYERARKYYADHKMQMNNSDLEAKSAFVRQRGAKPSVRPATKPAM